MCGSGTTQDAAHSMGIISHCYDLHSGFDLINCEIPERPEFVFWHPPYWDLITYSDVMYKASEVQSKYGYDPRQFDLSRIPKWEDFVRVMNYAMMKQFCSALWSVAAGWPCWSAISRRKGSFTACSLN